MRRLKKSRDFLRCYSWMVELYITGLAKGIETIPEQILNRSVGNRRILLNFIRDNLLNL